MEPYVVRRRLSQDENTLVGRRTKSDLIKNTLNIKYSLLMRAFCECVEADRKPLEPYGVAYSMATEEEV